MSTITLNNRVTSFSDSNAAFVSCTALPIQQTTLNIEDMENMEGGNPLIPIIEIATGLVLVTSRNPRVAAIGGALIGTGVSQIEEVVDYVLDAVSDTLDEYAPSYLAPPPSA